MAPPKKFKTTEEMYQHLDSSMDQLAHLYGNYSNAINKIANIFTSGYPYKDEKGNEIISDDKTGLQSQKLITALYGAGIPMLREADRIGSVEYFMMWYCRTNGVSSEEIIKLGENPDSPESQATITKIEGLKEDFRKMLVDHDTEKFSDMVMNVFDEFSKESGRLKQCDSLEGFVQNAPYLFQFIGITGVQQSLETPSSPYTSTPQQQAIIDSLNKKIKEKYGNDLDLTHMLGSLEFIHYTGGKFKGAKMSSTEEREDHKETLRSMSSSDRISTIEENRASVIEAMRGIYGIAKTLQKSSITNPDRFYSTEFGNFGAYGMLFSKDILGEKYNTSSSDYILNERKLLLGDPTGYIISDTNLIPEITFGVPGEKSQVSTFTSFESQEKVYSVATADDVYESLMDTDNGPYSYNDKNYSSRFMAELAENVGSGRTPNHYQIGFYLTSDNEDYTAKQRDITEKIFSHDISFRPSSLKNMDPIQGAVLKEKMGREYAVSPNTTLAEFALGTDLIDQNVRGTYHSGVSKGTEPVVNAALHQRFMKEFGAQLASVDVTIFSSGEFKEMSKAFHALEDKTLLEKGNEKRYQEKMENLERLSRAYVNAKETDGKKERSSDRGQIRYNLARKMHAFAKATRTCIAERINNLDQPALSEEKTSVSPEKKKNDAIENMERIKNSQVLPGGNKYAEFAKIAKGNDIDPYQLLDTLANNAREKMQVCIKDKKTTGIAGYMKLIVINELAQRDKATGFDNIPGFFGEAIMENCKTEADVQNFFSSNRIHLGDSFDTYFNQLKAIGKNDKFFEKCQEFLDSGAAKEAKKITFATVNSISYLKDPVTKVAAFGKNQFDITENMNINKLKSNEWAIERLKKVNPSKTEQKVQSNEKEKGKNIEKGKSSKEAPSFNPQ